MLHKTNLKNIRLDWIVRHREDVSWIDDEIRTLLVDLRTLFLSGNLVFNIYVCSSSDTIKTLAQPTKAAGSESDFAKKEEGADFNQNDTESVSTLNKSGNELFEELITVTYSKPELSQVINDYEIGYKNWFYLLRF